eukprot:5590783-Amphidinium_carterae.4
MNTPTPKGTLKSRKLFPNNISSAISVNILIFCYHHMLQKDRVWGLGKPSNAFIASTLEETAFQKLTSFEGAAVEQASFQGHVVFSPPSKAASELRSNYVACLGQVASLEVLLKTKDFEWDEKIGAVEDLDACKRQPQDTFLEET